jgi:coproporphyrinogen III oxidase
MVPTVHANFRYLEKGRTPPGLAVGADLTPYYPHEDDAFTFTAR